MDAHHLINHLHPALNPPLGLVTVAREGQCWSLNAYDLASVSYALSDNGQVQKLWLVGLPTPEPAPPQLEIPCRCGRRYIIDEATFDDPHLRHLS